MIRKIITVYKSGICKYFVHLSDYKNVMQVTPLIDYISKNECHTSYDFNKMSFDFETHYVDYKHLAVPQLLFKFLESEYMLLQTEYFSLERIKVVKFDDSFIYQIRVKRKDGLVYMLNEHRLTNGLLEKIIYFIISPFLIKV